MDTAKEYLQSACGFSVSTRIPFQDAYFALDSYTNGTERAVLDALFHSAPREYWTYEQVCEQITIIIQAQDVLLLESKRLNEAFASQLDAVTQHDAMMQAQTCARMNSRDGLIRERDSLMRDDVMLNETFQMNDRKHEELFASGRRVMISGPPPSPRSFAVLVKLDGYELMLQGLEREFYAFVPKINEVETRTALMLLAGRADELQAKHVDAISSVNLGSRSLVAARRKSLGKRLETLSLATRLLLKISKSA